MITTLGFTTRDRPDYLDRCVRSFAGHCREYGRRARLLIMDDADPDRHASARAVAEAIARSHPDFEVKYVGLAERRTFAAALAAGGIPADAAEFALLNPDCYAYQLGANRNALQLATLGEQVLFVDDDCLAQTSRPPEWDDTLAVVGPSSTQEYWFYPDHDAALAAASPQAVDLLGRHEAFLGRSCEEIVRDAPSYLDHGGGWTPFMRSGSIVKVTQNGVVGDSCMFSNIGHLLHGSARTRARLSASPGKLATALSSREIIRSASHPTLRLGGMLIGPDFGCDHSTLLPPFFPAFRSSDTTFSLLLTLAYPGHATADVPWLVTHHSLPGRRYSGRGVSEPWQVSVGEVIRGLLQSETPTAYRSVANPLLSIGERMTAYGGWATGEFSAVVRDLVDEMIEGKANRLEWLLDGASGAEPQYTAVLQASLRVLADSASDPRRFLPVELSAGVPPEQALARLQRLVARFGDVLRCWRDIDTVTRMLAASGTGLAVPP
jgi:hypothetical protein